MYSTTTINIYYHPNQVYLSHRELSIKTEDFMQSRHGPYPSKVNSIRALNDNRIVGIVQKGEVFMGDLTPSPEEVKMTYSFNYRKDKGISALSLAIDPSQTRFFVGTSRSQCFTFDSQTGKPIKIFAQRDAKGIASLLYCGDDRVLSGNNRYPHSILKWQLNNGYVVKKFTGHTDVVNNLTAVSDTHFVSSSLDGTVKVWDYEKSKHCCEFTLLHGTEEIHPDRERREVALCMGSLKDPAQVIIGTRHQHLAILDVETHEKVGDFGVDKQAHDSAILAMDSTYDPLIVSGSLGSIKVWDCRNYELVRTFELNLNERVDSVAMFDNGWIIAGVKQMKRNPTFSTVLLSTKF